jgi:hypothetical protein
MLVLDRILAIPDYDDRPQMGLSRAGLAAIVERGGITADGTKASPSVLKRADIKGDKPLSENTSLTSDQARKIKGAIASTANSKKVTKSKSPDNRVPKKLGKLSKPVRELVVPDYPLGGNKRGEMRFSVESHPTKGERIVRQSKGNKPKYSTYSTKKAIATGEDGRTYLLSHEAQGLNRVSRHDFMDAPDDYQFDGAFRDSRKPESLKAFSKAKKFIESAK